MPQAISAARDALQLDEELAEAHVSLGCARSVFEWNWPDAEQEFRRGIELNPDYAVAYQWYAINLLTPLGRFSEALTEAKKALELDPVSLVVNSSIGLIHYFAREHDTSIAYFRKTLEMDPDFPVTNFFIGRAYVQTGRFQEANEHFQKALKIYGDSTNMLATFGHAAAVSGKKEIALKILNQLLELSHKMYVSSYDISSIYCGLNDTDQALFWLEKAMEERAYLIIYLKVDPLMDPLLMENRYQQLVKKLFPET
ncbi:MAG: tetratricopeptide repeat protein [Calditrichaeota bacterium]|nr:MAG: tetratricopeptide repeat protein [Calditrichota bacterium]